MDGTNRTPSAPRSIVSKNSLASSAVLASIMSLEPEPWKCTMRFSSGMTFQSFAEMTTVVLFSANFLACSSSSFLRSSTNLPIDSPSSKKSLSFRTMALNLPSRSNPWSFLSRTMVSKPFSSAERMMFFLLSLEGWKSAPIHTWRSIRGFTAYKHPRATCPR